MDLPELENQIERSLKSFDYDYRTPEGQTLSQAGIRIYFRNHGVKRVGAEFGEVDMVFRTVKPKVTTADKASPNLQSFLNRNVLTVAKKLVEFYNQRKFLGDQVMTFREFDTTAAMGNDNYWTVDTKFSLPIKI